MMRRVFIITLFTLISIRSLAQIDGPREITHQIEFSRDTFYIGQVMAQRMKIDYTTAGMNKAVQEMSPLMINCSINIITGF